MHTAIILVGHRASGKSVLGASLARALCCPHIDIDALLEAESGEAADVMVTRDEEHFRTRERVLLERTLEEHGTRISKQRRSRGDTDGDGVDEALRGNPAEERGDTALIASCVVSPGAGVRSIPPGHLVIWLYREGWQETAGLSRRRLRPELSFDEEVRWMTASREDRYGHWSHYRVHIERGCSEDTAAERLTLIARWLLDARRSAAAGRCWMVPSSDEDLHRCAADARLFGLAGVEIRSDRFDTMPDIDVPVLASLRTADRGFFRRCSAAAAFDCDVTLLDTMQLDGLEPRPLLLSAHPRDVFREYFMELTAARTRIEERYPSWAEHVRFKYAPVVKSWVELRFAFQMVNFHQRKDPRYTFLPQGKGWSWMRAIRLHGHNEYSYLSPGYSTHAQAPPGIGYFLPFLTEPAPTEYYGIIGMPVEQSRGDVFHRDLSLREDGGRSAYVKIPVSQPELDNALHLLPTLGIRGLSITSPLKRAVVESNFVGTPGALLAGNTLSLVKGSFLLFDTDEAGMRASLRELAAAGAVPGPVALFGTGGVAAAVLRALDAEGWGPVHTVSARDGWGEVTGQHFALVVNASGPGRKSRQHPPSADAWIDLHYNDLEPAPPGVRVYRNGGTFFEAQALAQREIWKKGDTMQYEPS